MHRTPLAALVALAAGPAFAQDMPLSEIVKPGAGWKASPTTADPDEVLPPDQALADKSWELPGVGKPTAMEVTRDGGTVFLAGPNGRHVWAGPAGGGTTKFAPYCPLRLRPGETTLAVADLLMDSAGRVYALTADGIQVFDPTGRLCGVLLLPAKGTPQSISWRGDHRDTLTLRLDGKTYTRVLYATGPK